ncbi:MAG: hypothetical protein OER56_01695 [Hyphomicrobiales bacterium]|nr:hypothetical protein [Hyphomicrobiales bacterium]
MKATVIEARKRRHGLSEERAAGIGAGSALGLMFDPRGAWHDQRCYDAGVSFEAAHRDMLHARDYKKSKSATDFDGAGGHDNNDGEDPAYIEQCDRAIARYDAMAEALQRCGDPQAFGVVFRICIDNALMWAYIGEARIGLNAIAHIDKGGANRQISLMQGREIGNKCAD